MRPAIACAGVAFGLVAAPAHAKPQVSTAAVAGLSAVGDRDDLWGPRHFTLGARGDVLFGRDRDLAFGGGPYVEVLTASAFHDLQVGGGAELLVPVHAYLPIVLGAGPYAAHSGGAWSPGVAGSLFWGSRGFNYHSYYGLSGGLLLQARVGLGDTRDVTWIAAAQVDLTLLALPWLIAFEGVHAN